MWEKKGILFEVEKHVSENIISHAAIPFCLHVEGDNFRIYFSSRNKNGKSLPYYINATISNGEITLSNEVSNPLMSLGELGTFDDCGIMPSCLLRDEDKIYMYYIGWNPQVTVSYRLSIGLAVSYDNGLTFNRVCEGPVSDRSIKEPYFNTAPYIIKEDNCWKMWYISCTQWKMINDYPEPSYLVKYTESLDGINWDRERIVSIQYDDNAKAIGRPCVIKKGSLYHMYFSFRDVIDYRTVKGKGYQLGYATSSNGKEWIKKYVDTNIGLSDSGWDSNMMEYCHVFTHEGFEYMVYNGNDFGKEGFGYATRKI